MGRTADHMQETACDGDGVLGRGEAALVTGRLGLARCGERLQRREQQTVCGRDQVSGNAGDDWIANATCKGSNKSVRCLAMVLLGLGCTSMTPGAPALRDGSEKVGPQTMTSDYCLMEWRGRPTAFPKSPSNSPFMLGGFGVSDF